MTVDPGRRPVIVRHFEPSAMFDIAAALVGLEPLLAAAAVRSGAAGIVREALRFAAFAAEDPDLAAAVDSADDDELERLAVDVLHNPLTDTKETPR